MSVESNRRAGATDGPSLIALKASESIQSFAAMRLSLSVWETVAELAAGKKDALLHDYTWRVIVAVRWAQLQLLTPG